MIWERVTKNTMRPYVLVGNPVFLSFRWDKILRTGNAGRSARRVGAGMRLELLNNVGFRVCFKRIKFR